MAGTTCRRSLFFPAVLNNESQPSLGKYRADEKLLRVRLFLSCSFSFVRPVFERQPSSFVYWTFFLRLNIYCLDRYRSVRPRSATRAIWLLYARLFSWPVREITSRPTLLLSSYANTLLAYVTLNPPSSSPFEWLKIFSCTIQPKRRHCKNIWDIPRDHPRKFTYPDPNINM